MERDILREIGVREKIILTWIKELINLVSQFLKLVYQQSDLLQCHEQMIES
jgi:hypothetical protein